MVLSLPILGQNQYIGFKTGLNLNNISSENFMDDTGNRTGLTFGFIYELELKNQILLGADFLYSQKGFTNDISFTSDNGTIIGEETSKYNYDYLSIPIKVGIKRGKKISASISTGIVPSVLIKDEFISPMLKDLMDTYGLNETSKINRFDIAGLVEINGNYNLNNKFVLFASVSYQRSFTSITNSEYLPGSKVLHLGGTASVGIKYSLKK